MGEAREALATAHEALEVLRRETVTLIGKRQLVEKNVDLYRCLVACCLEDGDEVAAFGYAVAGKGRLFIDLLASERLDLTTLVEQQPDLGQDLTQEQELQKEVDQSRMQLQAGASGRNLQGQREAASLELQRAQDALTKHQKQMNERYPAFMATQSMPALSVAQAHQLAAEVGATLVEYFRHAEGWCAFVVTSVSIRHVPLPDVDKELLAEIECWTSDIESRFARGQLSYQPLYEWYSELIQPLALPKASSLVVAPFGALHRMPFTALRQAKDKPYLAEQYRLFLVPNLGALRVALDQQRRNKPNMSQQAEHLLSVAYPGEPPLPNVLNEAQTIAKYFSQVTKLHNGDATPKAVLKAVKDQEALRAKDVIHFGGHGWFDMKPPTQSALQLAEHWLTVQHIITDLPLSNTELVCQSGQSATQRGDEEVGLIQALMTASANSGVARSNVNDTATRALFESFYNHLMGGEAPVSALYQAQQAVRKRWSHPYFRAGFAISGLPHQPIKQTLTTRLNQLKKESQQRAGSPMNKERIIKDSPIILDQIADYGPQLKEAFAKDQTSGVIFATLLADLTKKARKIQNEADLLFIAHAIQILVEDTPPLRQLLMDEPASEISKAQLTRAVTILKHRPNQNDDQRALEQKPTLIQDMVECNITLAEILPTPDELARQEPTFSQKLTAMTRKIGLLAEVDEDDEANPQEEAPKGFFAKISKWLGLA